MQISPLAYISTVLALGVIAQWFAWRLKLPSILLLLAFGFGLGQITGVRIDDFLTTDVHNSPLLPLVGVLVAIILFEGGLTLKFVELKESGAPVLRLCTIAVVVSFAASTAFGMYALDYNWRVAAIVGAILTVTGPTVIGPLLRHVNPTRKMASILKWEGIVVDPIGAILAVLVFQVAVTTDVAAARSAVLTSLGITLFVGVVMALVLAKAIEIALRRHWIPDYLQPVFLLSAVAVAFAASNALEKEAGLLTVTVMGIALANQKSVSVRHILEFKENLRVLIISSLFIILSGRIERDALLSALPQGLMLLAFLIIVGRPLSVLVSLLFSKRTAVKERIFLAALAPRGIVAAAVTSIFALELEEAASQGAFQGDLAETISTQSQEVVAVVFIVIIGTVAFYGLLAAPLARKLGLATKSANGVLFAGADRWARLTAAALKEEGYPVLLLDTNYRNIADAKMTGLRAMRANILSEFAEEELELTGIGTLIAATPNDEVNSMAGEVLLHQFGRANIWQVTPTDANDHHTTSVSHHLRGRLCFSGAPNFEDLRRLARDGGVIKKTLITDKFTLDDFYAEHGGHAYILFLVSDDKGLRPAPADLEEVASGTTIFAMIPSEEESSAATTGKSDSGVPMGL